MGTLIIEPNHSRIREPSQNDGKRRQRDSWRRTEEAAVVAIMLALRQRVAITTASNSRIEVLVVMVLVVLAIILRVNSPSHHHLSVQMY